MRRREEDWEEGRKRELRLVCKQKRFFFFKIKVKIFSRNTTRNTYFNIILRTMSNCMMKMSEATYRY